MVRLCSDLRDDYPIFSRPSREFFEHVKDLGNQSLAYLDEFPDQVFKDVRLTSTKRQKLLSLRTAWESLHQYIRPALDADSLHLPTPLIAALHDKLHEVEEWALYRFTLFHTVEANYLQLPSDMVGLVANDIAALIGGKQFPACLGHIGIPYSQADGLFLNCILAHEMAHFIYQEDAAHDIDEQIDSALESMEQEVGTLPEEDIANCQKLVRNWVQETFCDLFAICQIGPAFSFAFSQLVASSMLIGRDEGEPADFYIFEDTHPALVARFRTHQALLEKLGWWDEIRNWSSAPVQVLDQCKRQVPLYTIEVQLPAEVTEERLLQCYNEVCTWMNDYLPTRVKSPAADVARFHEESPVIAEYLRRAIVPSTIQVSGRSVHPNPVVLINAGYRFLLEDLSGLISNIEKGNQNSIESRSWVTERLELWLLKALEDYRLLAGQEC